MTGPQARDVVAGLGEAVLHRLSALPVLGTQRPGSQHIQQIDAGSITLSSRDGMAAHIADTVAAHLLHGKGGR
jgi:hypothetical protein